MPPRAKAIMKMTAVGGLVVVAAAMAISRMHHFTEIGEEGLRAWYYDQSEGELYAVPRETIPPHKGIGGEKNDGVRAVVVAGQDDCGDDEKRRIAYLETYTPEYKQLAEGVRAA